MLGLPNGETIATAVIGREGALGALSVLGENRSLSSVTAVVRVGANLRRAFSSSLHGEQRHPTCGPGAH
jgi:hypothetical protein